ncbi:hypothetical protein NM208_g3877 [Fusarium decemcellulare]|uniref:Uncharacterized protein n=1 Tax=Fusarium decemcellulare TaxID=57161 RepID=A0ACC1SMS3_9HYPO|nr:hypothetical protein NM208_g3877 [Fusarium decemcellulare]
MIPTVTTTPENVPTNSPDDCKLWYYANGEDTCDAIAAIFGTFTTEDFIAWNPSVLKDCSAIANYVWYCIARFDALVSTRTYGLRGTTGLPPQMSTQPDVSQQSSNSTKTTTVNHTAVPGNNPTPKTNYRTTRSNEASLTPSVSGGSHGE